MTFQYSFSFVPQVRVEPGLLRDRGGEAQMLRLSLDNLRRGRAIQILVANHQITSTILSVGSNVFYIPVGAVNTTRAIPVFFTVNDVPITRKIVVIKPVTRREIYLLSYSHNDIGYTDLQPNIEKKQWRNLEEALRLIKQTKDYPPDARYKWNMEVMWSLDGYLRQAPEAKRQEVIDAIKEGNISLNAFYANMLTGLANAVEMHHIMDFARTFSRTYSVPITTALVSDVPGFTWGIVPALAQAGVKYFSISPNPGDRIGYTIEEWGDKPFYWKSQSGKEQILAWVAGSSYASFHEGDLTKLGDEKIFKLIRKLDDTDYPYDIVQLPYTIGGDNGPPDPNLSDFVKRWNERYASPRLIIATHKQMFEEFERRCGSTLPTFGGDFTPYWEDGAASSAYETALNRQAADRLNEDEALWSIRSPGSFPDSAFADAWRNVVLYDEHTWGAHNSISEPDLPFVKDQWAIKRQFALDADSLSRVLQPPARQDETKEKKGERGIDVFNTHSWYRTDVVYLAPEQSAVGDLVVDASGNRIPSQRLSTGDLAVLIKDIAPMSAKRVYVKKGAANMVGGVSLSGNTLENNLLSVSVDNMSGAIESLLWKRNGLQLVDKHKGEGLNEYLYVPGKDPDDARHVTNVKVSVKERGKLLSSLLVEADAPGCRGYSYEVRVLDGIDRVDIIDRLDKEAIRTKEGVHIFFPFNIPQGTIRYDVALGIVRPEDDQLPGACKNFLSVQSWVDISNDQRGITWSTHDAPLVEIGAINAEKRWMKDISNAQNFYSYVMNNYWHTNYKADQGGPATFRYSIQPHGGYKSEEAARFGLEQREPLLAVTASGAAKADNSLYELESSSILVLSTRPIPADGAWLLYLYNPTNQLQTGWLHWNRNMPVSIYASDSCGRTGEEISEGVRVPAYGSIFVRVNRK
jgi:hypothetical protein